MAISGDWSALLPQGEPWIAMAGITWKEGDWLMHLGLVIVEELLFPRLIDHALKALLMVKMDMKL